MFAENVSQMRRLGNLRVLAGSLEGLGLSFLAQGGRERAQPLMEESLRIARDLGERRQIASSLLSLGDVLRGEDGATALTLFEEALSLARDMEDQFRVTACLESIGTLALEGGDYSRAAEALAEGLQMAHEAEYREMVPAFLEGLAGLNAVADRPVRAATLLGAAGAARESLGAPRGSDEERRYMSLTESLRGRLAETEWLEAAQTGENMSLDAAVNYALEVSAVAA
jgi:tetratricopeptide (TPR) repeat protein